MSLVWRDIWLPPCSLFWLEWTHSKFSSSPLEKNRNTASFFLLICQCLFRPLEEPVTLSIGTQRRLISPPYIRGIGCYGQFGLRACQGAWGNMVLCQSKHEVLKVSYKWYTKSRGRRPNTLLLCRVRSGAEVNQEVSPPLQTEWSHEALPFSSGTYKFETPWPGIVSSRYRTWCLQKEPLFSSSIPEDNQLLEYLHGWWEGGAALGWWQTPTMSWCYQCVDHLCSDILQLPLSQLVVKIHQDIYAV